MSTRAEKFRAETERAQSAKKPKKRSTRSKPGSKPSLRSRVRKCAGEKASYAIEESKVGTRPARKSTRKSANRSKPDTNLNLREGRAKGSPEAKHDKAKATSKAGRVRGGTPQSRN